MKAGLFAGKRRASVAIGAGSLALAAGLVGIDAGVAGAWYVPCPGEWVWDVPGGVGVELYDVSGYDVRNYPLATPLEPGEYQAWASSFDGYIGRADVPEAEKERSERWYAEFTDDHGNVVGHFDRPTDDLPDDEDAVHVLEERSVTLSATATGIRLVLVKDWQSLNLVHVGCVGMTRLPEYAPVDDDPAPETPEPETPAPEVPAPEAPAPENPEPEPQPTDPGSDGEPLAPANPAPTAPAPVPVATQTLPFTGTSTVPLALAGLGLVLAGAGMVARSRELGV